MAVNARKPMKAPNRPAERPEGQGMTDDEQYALDSLSDAWDAFVKLPDPHADDHLEFRTAIHMAQNIIGCRVARRINPHAWF